MDLSFPKDASDAPEDVASEEGSKSFPNQEEDTETATLVTADPLANLKAHFESQNADFESLALTMDLSIPNYASDTSEDVASEEDIESFPNQEEESETATLVTTDQLANLKADFESLKADFKSQLESQKAKAEFESQLDSETAALVTADPLANLKADFESQKADFECQKADFESLKADFKSQLESQKAKVDFESQLDSETASLATADPLATLKADFESLKADFESQCGSQKADFETQLDSGAAALVTADQHTNLKAEFESQKAEFRFQLESLQKSNLSPLKRCSQSRLEKEGKKQLPPDTFSFLACSKILSPPFLLGIGVFLFQTTIYSLLAVDLIRKKDSEGDRLARIPANIETIVRVTQFLAIIIAVLTQADLRTSLEQVNEGYSKDRIGRKFDEASRGKWWFAAACRFLEGALGLVVTFFLIVIEDNVFDLLLNFTAMEFVSQLDDVAFFLAGTGYFGSKNAEKSEEVDETTFAQATYEKKRRKILHVLLLVVVSSGTLAGWGVIVNQQNSNKDLCKQFFVYYSAQTELIVGGFYKLTPSRGRLNDERVQYIHQNGTEESEPASTFGYCDQETAWTYYSNGNPCDFRAKSAETGSYDIRTTLSSPWVAANLIQLDPIQFLCVDNTRVGESLPSFTGNLPGLGE
jgi:F0F1-type ATP synthase membrane subunit b/b'